MAKATTMMGPGTMPRRGFLQKGLWGGALLLVGGGAGIALRSTRLGAPPRAPLQLLSPGEHAVLGAVAARVVPGDGAPAGWPSAAAVDCAGKIDALLARCHPAVGDDFKQLLRLFENGLTGLFTQARWKPFTRLAPADQDARLEAWRHSRLTLLRSGYQALVRLVHATYYSSPELYPLLGYPGPPEVPV
jgi:gluconate 2-dehydrogenase subunit 3-like protein